MKAGTAIEKRPQPHFAACNVPLLPAIERGLKLGFVAMLLE
jgi:hypothetical protein